MMPVATTRRKGISRSAHSRRARASRSERRSCGHPDLWRDRRGVPCSAGSALRSGLNADAYFRRPADAAVWNVTLPGISPEAVKRNLELTHGPGRLWVAKVRLGHFGPGKIGIDGGIVDTKGRNAGFFMATVHRVYGSRPLVSYEAIRLKDRRAHRRFEGLLSTRLRVFYRLIGARI